MKNEKSLPLCALVLGTILLVGGFGAFLLFGREVVTALYEGRSIPFFSIDLIGRHDFTLEYYFHKADTRMVLLVTKCFLWLLLVCTIWLLAVRIGITATVFNMLVCVALFEATLWMIVRSPAAMNVSAFDTILKHVYFDSERMYWNMMPECAEYDSELTYKLKTNGCSLQQREFDMELRGNSLGFREDEASLSEPDIVVVGDSHGMGWGVKQEETFSALLEQKTGLKVLNTSLGSYGTVREFRTLDRVDLSNVKYLVVQYFGNDFGENKAFYDNRDGFQTLTKEEYQKEVANYAKEGRGMGYRFGFFYRILPSALQESVSNKLMNIVLRYRKGRGAPNNENPAPGNDAVVALHAISFASKKDLTGIPILIFDVGLGSNNFAEKLVAAIALHREWPYVNQIVPIDLRGVLGEEHYFKYDRHINTDGHMLIADVLIDHIKTLAPTTNESGS